MQRFAVRTLQESRKVAEMSTAIQETSTAALPGDSIDQEPVELVGVLAEFKDVASIMTATHAVRAAGFTRWDVHSPFPIHGIDAAIGIKPTILPWLVLAGGLSGCIGGLAL